MSNYVNAVIPHIIDQHAEEASFLWLLRDAAVSAPHYDLNDLSKLDDRIEAHLDGLRIAGDYGWQVCSENLQQHQEIGEVFSAAILALEGHSTERINQVYAVVEGVPETVNGLISAFGWVTKDNLQGKVSGLLLSNSSLWRRVGIAACTIHRVDPGKYLTEAILDEDVALRVRSLQAVGELGRVDLMSQLLEQLSHKNQLICFWAAWSGVLLGDRGKALQHLREVVIGHSGDCLSAMQVALPILDSVSVKKTLKELADDKDTLRLAIIGAGISGDLMYVPWLIQQMQAPELAKVAGEAFSHICGVDLAYEDLEGEIPAEMETAGPTEDPEDESVDMDADEDLPYPDQVLVQRWWQDKQQAFKQGQRYLYGKPADKQQCLWILGNGTQRLRYAAAIRLALMQADQPVFSVAELGKRQQKAMKSK